MSEPAVSSSNMHLAAQAASTLGAPRPLGVTQRNFLKAMLYCAMIVAVFGVGYWIERDVLNRHPPANPRFIREASEAAMRYITIPHILIGFMFMWSSPKNRTRRQRLWVLALLIVGALLCVIYGLGGGKTNLILYSGVYLYFLVHELRDEAMFYTVLGEAPPIHDKIMFHRMARAMIGLIVLTLAAMLWSLAPFGVYARKFPDVTLFNGDMPNVAKILLSATPLLACFAGFHYTLKHFAARLGFANTAALVRTHAVLFRVLFGVTGVLGLSLLLTQRAYSLILFHVVAWYIFAGYQFSRRPPASPPKDWWTWMRTTTTGFRVLHIGMVVVLMAIGLVWTLSLGQTPYLAWLLAPESFLYWTIMHITVSFVPR